jgi:hypothetical protein
VTIDLEYLTQGSVIEERYSNFNYIDYIGTRSSDLKNLVADGDASYIFYGYFYSPFTQRINFGMLYDDDGSLVIDDNLYYSGAGYKFDYGGKFDISSGRTYSIKLNCQNTKGGYAGIIFYWNINGSFETIPSHYLYQPARPIGSPLMMGDVKGYYVCDDVWEFRCVECAGLCLTCEAVTAEIFCESCKPNSNSSLRDRKCYCDEGYYLPNTDSTECVKCPGVNCKTCPGAVCSECFTPWELDENLECMCPDDHYIEDGNCIEITILLTVSISTGQNSLKLKFSKPLSQPLNISDLDFKIQDSELETLITYQFNTITNLLEYEIRLNCDIKLNSTLNTNLAFKTALIDYQGTQLQITSYSTQVSVDFDGPCVEDYRLLSCKICSDLGYKDIGCSLCDDECRCITKSWNICQAIVPYVYDSIWEHDMLSFKINFNIQIIGVKSSDHSCEVYFTETSMEQLGMHPLCKLDSSRKMLEVNIGLNSYITSGPYQLKQNAIISQYNPGLYIDSTNLNYITVPPEYPDPIAVLNLPSKITYCSNLILDGSLSYGNRRDFTTEWSLFSQTMSEQLEEFSEKLSVLSKKLLIELESEMIKDLTEIEVSLKITNLFGKSSTATTIVEITKSPVPEVKFLAGPYVEILSSMEYSPYIDIKWPRCNDMPSKYSYEWSVEGNNNQNRRLESLIGQQFLTIPANYLSPYNSYIIKAKVIPDYPDSEFGESQQIVNVLESPIVVMIQWGNREADISRDIILDGSNSYDPDNPTSSLSYEWKYSIKNTPSKLLQTHNSAQLIIPANSFTPNQEYIFTLSVNSVNKSSKSSVYILTTLNKVPDIYLFPQFTTLNPSATNIIQSSIQRSDSDDYSLKWTVSGGGFDLSSPDNRRSISIYPNTLHSGATYTLILDYLYKDISTRATLDIYVNTPPLYGSFGITPEKRRALDIFTFIINGWEDMESNYPLYYQLYKELDSNLVKLADLYYGNTFDSILAPGINEKDYESSYVLYVFDSLGAYSLANCNATVYPLSYNEALNKSQGILSRYKDNLESIDNLRSITSTLIQISDTILYSNIDGDYDADREIGIVKDCLNILEHYTYYMLRGSSESANVISALDRITTRSYSVDETSRYQSIKYFYKAIEASQGLYYTSAINSAIFFLENLYRANEYDPNTSQDNKDLSNLDYYQAINKLGLSITTHSLINQAATLIDSNIFDIFYQRVSSDALNSTYQIGAGKLSYPDSIAQHLETLSIKTQDALDISLVYTNDKIFSEDSDTTRYSKSDYILKNAGMIHANITRSGYEDEFGVVKLEDRKEIEIVGLEEPILIYITAEFLNISDTNPNCTYLNESTFEWDTEGCSFIDDIPDENTVICACNHMSYYSVHDLKRDLIEAKDPNQADQLDPTKLTEVSIRQSYAIIIALTLTLIIQALLSFKFNQIDNIDLKRVPQVAPEILQEANSNIADEDLSKTHLDIPSAAISLNQINIEIQHTIPKEVEGITMRFEVARRRNYNVDKPAKFLIIVQDIQERPKNFHEFYMMSNEILELKFVIDYGMSKLKRLSLIFYAIYANIFIMGFFYKITSEESIKDQILQIIEAMEFTAQDVILFIYTKAVVMIPLKILKFMLRTDPKEGKFTLKNKIGVGIMIAGYLGSALGIILLGINFEVMLR